MNKKYTNLLQQRLPRKEFAKIKALNNPEVVDFVGQYVQLCNPKSVFVRTDKKGDINYIKKRTITLGEEKKLSLAGQTIHFDGPKDQARDKAMTKYLLPESAAGSGYLNSIEREKGLNEITGLLKNVMADKEMLVCFFCLGPVNSKFSIAAVQITDSVYVAHSEDMLYRPGYGQFKEKRIGKDFFKFVHSAGRLNNCTSQDVDKRRVYIDLKKELVYSVNTQYAGNTVGLKKLALRLAIQKASREDWLAEHMFIMSVSDQKKKKAYFCGAFPSMCGKTSTAMLPTETIIGDDIAYLKIEQGNLYAANVERGIFGIIKGVNAKDDPIIFKTLTTKGEVIFSNVLATEQGIPFWTGKSADLPHKGVNFSGNWRLGKTDREGNEVPISHKNARYTVRLRDLKNMDRNLEASQGVEVAGIIYGGRDSDTSVPVEEALSWRHGVITKAASLESETTAATLGQEGVRVFNPMANIDFLSIPAGNYIKMHLDTEKKLSKAPLIFAVNYFLRDSQGNFLNQMQDKLIWLKWMRLRVDKKVPAHPAPTGLIPQYKDLKTLFKQFLKKEYRLNDYAEQFKIRIPENLAKIERIRTVYKKLTQIPAVLFTELDNQEKRLKNCRSKFGDYVNPDNFKEAK